MKEYPAKIWLPDLSKFCDCEDRCYLLVGRAYCILLGETLCSDGNYLIKDDRCPAITPEMIRRKRL